jgi:hypothetical protein
MELFDPCSLRLTEALSNPRAPRTPFNTLILQAFNNRTKMGVVRLCQRTGARETKNGPKMALSAAARGSDKWPQRSAFCGIPAGAKSRKKNVPDGETGGPTGTRVKHSQFEISIG